MGNAQKALVMAAGIFLAIALITIAVVMFISAQDATKTAQGNFSNIQTELAQTSFTVYDNTTVSGSQVVNALRKFSNAPEFGMHVITGKGGNTWYYHELNVNTPTSGTNDDFGSVVTSGTFESGLTLVTKEDDPNYVNPSGKFSASLIYDHNNVVRGITFEQQP